MKKISVTVNALFLCIIIFLSCNKSNLVSPNDSGLESPGKAGVKTSADAGYISGKQDCPHCVDHTQTPFNGLSATTAFHLSQNYKTLSQPLLAIDANTPDANSIWFSLESLKNFPIPNAKLLTFGHLTSPGPMRPLTLVRRSKLFDFVFKNQFSPFQFGYLQIID